MTTDQSGFARPAIDQHTVPSHPRTFQAALMARFRSLSATERQAMIDEMQKVHNGLDYAERYGVTHATRGMGV